MVRGAWLSTVHGDSKRWTWLINTFSVNVCWMNTWKQESSLIGQWPFSGSSPRGGAEAGATWQVVPGPVGSLFESVFRTPCRAVGTSGAGGAGWEETRFGGPAGVASCTGCLGRVDSLGGAEWGHYLHILPRWWVTRPALLTLCLLWGSGVNTEGQLAHLGWPAEMCTPGVPSDIGTHMSRWASLFTRCLWLAFWNSHCLLWPEGHSELWPRTHSCPLLFSVPCRFIFASGLCVAVLEPMSPTCNAGDLGLIPGSARSPGEGNGNPLQYSCLGNPMDGGAWWATVYGITKSWTRLCD